MADDGEDADEATHLLPHNRRSGSVAYEADATSVISSHISKDEQALGDTAIGERLPYNDYTTIDWLHDLVSLIVSIERFVLNLTGQRLLPLSGRPRREGHSRFIAVCLRCL